MAQCPKCGTPVDQDFGIFNCPGCATILLVNVDGEVQLNSETTSDTSPAAEPAELPPMPVFNSEEQVPPPLGPSETSAIVDVLSEEPMNVPVLEANVSETPQNEESLPIVPAPMEEFSMEPSHATEAPLVSEASQLQPVVQESESVSDPVPGVEEIYYDESPAPVAPESTDPLDQVVSFANRDQVAGVFSYFVEISGIDHAELREQVAQVLSDPKFGWNPRQVLSKVDSGTLKFEKLNPAQAAMLVKRLQSLPVEIRWRQDVLS